MSSGDSQWFQEALAEATEFVEVANTLQTRMRIVERLCEFDEIHQHLEGMYRDAQERFGQFEQLADIWRGSEFNLSQYFRNERSVREREARRAALHEAEVRSWLNMTAVTPAPEAPAEPAALPEPTNVVSQPHPLPTNLQELIALAHNEAQKQALHKLRSANEADRIYLASYEPNTDMRGRNAELEGTFTVLGSIRNGNRESYTIKWYKHVSARPSFWCNCPDHKFNSGKKNMVCKHICFLVVRVGRIFDQDFFTNKSLTEEQHEIFRAAVGNAAIFADGQLERERLAQRVAHSVAPVIVPGVAITNRQATFFMCRRPPQAEDSCPICYDDMCCAEGDAHGSAPRCLSCPTCSNNVHQACMEVWLERNDTCVYCRSTVWRAYKEKR